MRSLFEHLGRRPPLQGPVRLAQRYPSALVRKGVAKIAPRLGGGPSVTGRVRHTTVAVVVAPREVGGEERVADGHLRGVVRRPRVLEERVGLLIVLMTSIDRQVDLDMTLKNYYHNSRRKHCCLPLFTLGGYLNVLKCYKER